METKDSSWPLEDFIWFFRLSLVFLLLTQEKYFVSKLLFTLVRSPEIPVWFTPGRWSWNLFFQKLNTVSSLLDNAVPCNAKEDQNGWLVLEHQLQQLDPPSETEVSPIPDFVSFLKLQLEYISQYYNHVEFYINPLPSMTNLAWILLLYLRLMTAQNRHKDPLDLLLLPQIQETELSYAVMAYKYWSTILLL